MHTFRTFKSLDAVYDEMKLTIQKMDQCQTLLADLTKDLVEEHHRENFMWVFGKIEELKYELEEALKKRNY